MLGKARLELEKAQSEQDFEDILNRKYRIFTADGNFSPQKFGTEAKLEKDQPWDCILVASFERTPANVPLGLQRLAETCHQHGQKVAILDSRDYRSFEEKLGTSNELFETLSRQVLGKFRNIGFSVFDGDVAFLIEFLNFVNENPSFFSHLQNIIVGGVGINDNHEFFVKELTLAMQKLTRQELSGIADKKLLIVCGEGDDLLPDILKGNLTNPSIQTLDINCETRSVPYHKVHDQGLDSHLMTMAPLAQDGRWIYPKDILEYTQGRIKELEIDNLMDTFSELETISMADGEITRDCPHGCNFCALRRTSDGAVRRLRPADVIEQIRNYLKHGKFNLSFQDDDLFFDRNWWNEFTPMLLDDEASQLVTFAGFAQPATIHKYTHTQLARIAACGLGKVRFGLESADPEELRSMGRAPKSPAWILETLPGLKELGVAAAVNFISGYPGYHRRAARIYGARMDFMQRARDIMGDEVSFGTSPFTFAPGSARKAMAGVLDAQSLGSLDAVHLVNPFKPEHSPWLRTRFGRFGEVLYTENLANGRISFKGTKSFNWQDGNLKVKIEAGTLTGIKEIEAKFGAYKPINPEYIPTIFLQQTQLNILKLLNGATCRI